MSLLFICRVRIAAVNFKNKQLLLEMVPLPVSILVHPSLVISDFLYVIKKKFDIM